MQRCRMCGAEVVTAREHPLCAHCYRNSEFDHRAWLWIVLAIGIFIIAAVRGCAGVVTEEFLDQIAWVESRNNPAAVGRHGEHTAFQLKQCFVDDTCRFFGWRRLLITSLTPEQARAVARAGCLMLEHRLTRVGRPNPNQAQIYRSYRLGLAGCQRQSAASQGTFPPGSPRTTSPRAGRGADLPKSATEFGHIRVNPAAARGSVSGVIPNRQNQPLKTGTELVASSKCPDTLGSGATAGETATLTASVAERLKAPDSKSGVVVEPSRVRIPPVADQFGTKTAYLYNVWIQNPHYWTNTTK